MISFEHYPLLAGLSQAQTMKIAPLIVHKRYELKRELTEEETNKLIIKAFGQYPDHES